MAEPDDTSYDDVLADRIKSNPDAVARLLYDTYSVLKAITRQADWDAEYYADADELWNRLGEWMYP